MLATHETSGPSRDLAGLRTVVLRNQGKEGLHLHKVSAFARLSRALAPSADVRVSSPFARKELTEHLRITGHDDVTVETSERLGEAAGDLTIVFDLPAGRPFNWDERGAASEFVAQMQELAGAARSSRLWIHLSDAHRYRPWRIGIRRSDRQVLGARPPLLSIPSRDYLRARSSFWRALRAADLILVETVAQARWMRSLGLPVALFPGRLSDEEVITSGGSSDGGHLIPRVRELAATGATVVGVTGRALKGKKGTLAVVSAAMRANPNIAFVLIGTPSVPIDGDEGSVVFAGDHRLDEGSYLEVLRACDVLLNVPGPGHPLLHGTGSIADAIGVQRPLITAAHLIDTDLLGFASPGPSVGGAPLAREEIRAARSRAEGFDWVRWSARETGARLLAAEGRGSARRGA